MIKKIIAAVLLTLFTVNTIAQPYTKKTYIESFKDIAIKHMVEFGIPASITLAQACLESGYGNSGLTTNAKNHFGIKCHKSWDGEKVYHDDDEKGECFRKYKDDEGSFIDHADFLRYNKRYATLFDLGTTDYKSWAHGLKKAGYATNPKYAELLIKTIEENKFYDYDKKAKEFEANTEVIDVKTEIYKIKEKKTKTEKKPIVKIPSPSVIKTMELEKFTVELNRRIYSRNGVKYILANEGEDYKDLADEFKLRPNQLVKYNNLKKGVKIKQGQALYIKPKKSKADILHPVHIAQDGDTMEYISQLYAVNVKSLYKYNRMASGAEPEAGQEIYLRHTMSR